MVGQPHVGETDLYLAYASPRMIDGKYPAIDHAEYLFRSQIRSHYRPPIPPRTLLRPSLDNTTCFHLTTRAHPTYHPIRIVDLRGESPINSGLDAMA